MKIEWKTCFRICISVFLLFLAVFYWGNFAGLLSLIGGALLPVFIGFGIAYIVNIIMCFYEKHYFPRTESRFVQKSRRAVCLTAAFLTLVLIVVLVFSLVLPELTACISLLVNKIPDAVNWVLSNEILMGVLPDNWLDALQNFDWQSYVGKITQWGQEVLSGAFDVAAAVVLSVSSGLITGLLSLIFALYMLLGKEKLQNQICRLLRAYIKPAKYERLMHIASVFNDSFHRFVVGQSIEALILGSLCIIGMYIFRFPYALMIGTLIGFTALIPVVGAFIGAGIGAFMIFTVSPLQAVFFIIFIVILQQLEGNLIYPKVVGASIGLPAIWVLVAVTLGGGLFGILGMLLGVPAVAAIYRLLRENIRRREDELLK
ncbi:MAG: AI-2E family transporter [Firmicutes bacterium]|nr:AI-2E family transporter [Bacillota bacterium]